MPETRLQLLRRVFRKWWARIAVAVSMFAGLYQFACDQFGFPTIPAVWGMTGAIVPWWGWLLIAQAIFVYALFEYVRKLPGATASAPPYDAEPLIQRLTSLERAIAELGTLKDYLAARVELERLEAVNLPEPLPPRPDRIEVSHPMEMGQGMIEHVVNRSVAGWAQSISCPLEQIRTINPELEVELRKLMEEEDKKAAPIQAIGLTEDEKKQWRSRAEKIGYETTNAKAAIVKHVVMQRIMKLGKRVYEDGSQLIARGRAGGG